MSNYVSLFLFEDVGSNLVTDFFCQNQLDFWPIKKEDNLWKENLTDNTHINLLTVLLAFISVEFCI
jgi:hypothetical protein